MDVRFQYTYNRSSKKSAGLPVVVLATFVSMYTNGASAADSTVPHRFVLTGSGTLALDAPVQQNGALRLKAMLSAATAQAWPVAQSDARFALTGTLAAVSLVCYSDTIFRDDFDADGF
jgi:hypothetical protein